MTAARDFLLAAAAGLGIGLLSLHISHSANVAVPPPLTPLWLVWLVPAGAVAGIAVAKRLRRTLPILFQLAKFGLVGLLSASVDLAALNFLMDATGVTRGLFFPLLKAASFLLATINAFLWNRHWTFLAEDSRSTQSPVRQFSLYLTAATGGLALNVTVATLFVNLVPPATGWLPVHWANLGALIALLGTATWDFLCYKFIVFRPRRGEPPDHF